MTQTKRGLIFITLLIMTAAAGIRLWQSTTPQPAPERTFKTITNQDIVLKDLQGKPVIVTFWATDCPACIKEIPHLIELYEQYHPQGLEIIAVAMYYDPPSHVVEMSKLKQLPYHIALDLQAEHGKAFGDIMATPTTFLISPQGQIVLREIGMFDVETVKEKIEGMLAMNAG